MAIYYIYEAAKIGLNEIIATFNAMLIGLGLQKNMKRWRCAAIIFLTAISACQSDRDTAILTEDSSRVSRVYNTDSLKVDLKARVKKPVPLAFTISTANLNADSIVAYAKTLLGTPYVYAATDPAVGFDCSGFITYVFNHFNTAVPRSSFDFTNVGTEVKVQDAAPADLILFTGTDSTETFIGHMGIVVSNTDSLRFIHSTSGKANSVTITALNPYYQKRFVKVINIIKR